MKYHTRERIYCLSEEDKNDLIINSDKPLYYDSEVNNYFWILVSVKETDPDFFMISEEIWLKVVDLGYIGPNDIREIIDWMEFEYNISYTRHHYQGCMISGGNGDLLESHIILDHVELSRFMSVIVRNQDERSKYILMKEVLKTMLNFFEMKDGKVVGPSTYIFTKILEGETEWT